MNKTYLDLSLKYLKEGYNDIIDCTNLFLEFRNGIYFYGDTGVLQQNIKRYVIQLDHLSRELDI